MFRVSSIMASAEIYSGEFVSILLIYICIYFI